MNNNKNIDKNVKLFKTIIKYYFLVLIIFIIKNTFFPDLTSPDDLSFLVRKYEDEIMTYSWPIIFVGIIAAIVNLYSFLILYKLKAKWRHINLWTLIIGEIVFVELKFSYMDMYSHLLLSTQYVLYGMIIALAFFGTVAKRFK